MIVVYFKVRIIFLRYYYLQVYFSEYKIILISFGPVRLNFLYNLYHLCIADIMWLSNQGFELTFTQIFFAKAMKFIASTNLNIKSE